MRLFVAIQPPPEVIGEIRDLPRPRDGGIRWTDERTWHITLRFLGEVDDPDPVRDAIEAADLGAVVDVELGPTARWLGRDVVVLPAGGLDDLAARVTSATDAFVPPDRRSRFDGHLTIARRRRGARRVEYDAALAARFVAEDVVLFSSTLTETGAVHSAIARVPLRGT